MLRLKKLLPLVAAVSILAALLSGCGSFGGLAGPAPKPDVGPAGKPVEAKPNPPFMERFQSAPAELYDLEAIAGVVFEGINKKDWAQTQAGLSNLNTMWKQAKAAAGDKKGVKDADEAIGKLSQAVNSQKVTESYESLIAFMASVSDIGKSYKLSPIADIIAISNSVRNVSFYVEDKDWKKAAAKAKELEGSWDQVKPGMEKLGIMGQITRTHGLIKQMKDAVDAENKGAFEGLQANINESMGRIRDFYRGK